MKQNRIFTFVCIVSLLCCFNSRANECVAPGVRYKHFIYSGNIPQSIHLLVVDPNYASIKIGLSGKKCGANKTSRIASNEKAVAAVNGGFFGRQKSSFMVNFIKKITSSIGMNPYKVFPVFTLKLDEEWLSLSNVYAGTVGWLDEGKQVEFDALQIDFNLCINDNQYVVDNFNKPGVAGTSLYSGRYGNVTPCAKDVAEIVIYNDKIQDIAWHSRGKTIIPTNGYVYVIDESRLQEDFNVINIGDPTNIRIVYNSKFSNILSDVWHHCDFILGATPLLVKDEKILPYLYEFKSKFYINRYARTAVGVLKNGSWVFVVVDGKQKASQGFSILELALFMRELGCIHSLNLDGGGSSTMAVKGRVVNSPSGRTLGYIPKERPVANALVVVPKI